MTSSYGTVYYRVTEYLVHHLDGMKDSVMLMRLDFECDGLLKEEYNNAIMSEIALLLMEALSLSYEEVADVLAEEHLKSMVLEKFHER